jgi:hypothetical protein
MINAISDATENMEAESQIQNYQNARATAQARSTYQTMGPQAGIWIPMLKIVIESVFYGSFPLIILLCLIPTLTVGVLRGYLTTFFWLASWGPIYAILHRISMGHASSYLAPDVAGTGLGITLGNQIALQQIASDIAAMAGYMSMFVPMLSYGLAKGGAAAMSSMTTSFMSGIQGAVSTAAHEGTTGNLSFGNVGLNSRTVSEGITMQNDAGQIIHRHNDGTSSIDNSKVESRLGSDVHMSDRSVNEKSILSSNEKSIGESKTIQSQQSTAHGFERIINDHRSIESSKGFEENKNMEDKDSFSRITNAANDFAINHNISKEKSAEIFGNIGVGKHLGASGKISASDEKLYSEAQRYAKEHHLAKDFSVMQSAMQSNRFNLTDSKGESINQDFHKAVSLSKEASQHFEASKRYSEQAQYIKSHSIEIDRNYNQELWGALVEKYGNQTAARITNPSNPDKSIFNQEIDNFVQDKVREANIYPNHKPDFQSEFNRNSESYAVKYRPSRQMQNEQVFMFSNSSKGIDNSHLQQSTSNKFNEGQAIINDANARIDSSPKDFVRSEQEKGVIRGVIDKSIEEGGQTLKDTLNVFKAESEFSKDFLQGNYGKDDNNREK